MSNNQRKQVDFYISGHHYNINCPINEEETVQRAADAINQFIQDNRKKNTQTTHDQMLVMYCLNLFSENEQLKTFVNQEQQAKELLDNMIADAKALTP